MALVFLSNMKSFQVEDGVTVLEGARRAGIVLEHSCKTGRCGTCRAHMSKGAVNTIGSDTSLSLVERANGWVLTCTDAPSSDELHLDAQDISVLADFPSRTTPCRIDSIDNVAPDVKRIFLRFPQKASPKFLAGQYVDVIGPNAIRRSYSLANKMAEDGRVELHVRQVQGGALSQYWFELAKPNDLLRLEGPKGTFFLRDAAGTNLIFLATGTGMAPVKAMLEDLASRDAGEHPSSITVLWGGRHASDIYWQPIFEELSNFSFVPVLSRGDSSWKGERGHVQQALLRSNLDWANTVVYACGSQAMIDSASTELVASGLSPKRFFSDAFVSSSI